MRGECTLNVIMKPQNACSGWSEHKLLLAVWQNRPPHLTFMPLESRVFPNRGRGVAQRQREGFKGKVFIAVRSEHI